jgi:hypothetical protein
VGGAQSFGRIAAGYDLLIESHGHKGAKPADRWLLGLLPTAGRQAPDLGCGTGHRKEAARRRRPRWSRRRVSARHVPE